MATLYWHPEYWALRDDWIKWRDLYEGKHSVLTRDHNYLWPHNIELLNDPAKFGAKARAGRERRTRYLNLNEIIISLWTSFFYRKKYSLDPATTKMLADAGNAEANIDGMGTSLYTLIKDKITLSYFNYGRVFVLADSWPTQESSKGKEIEKGLRAYLGVLDPLSVPHWERETEDSARVGQFKWLRHEYDVIKPGRWDKEPARERVSQVLSVEDGKYLVRTFRAQVDLNGVVKSADPKQVAQLGQIEMQEDAAPITTGLEKIPLAYYESESWVKDVSEETLRCFNLRSNKDQIEYDQGYRTIFLIGDGIEERTEAITTSVWPILPGNSTVFPVDPVSTADLSASIAESIDLAFKLGLNQLRQIAPGSKEGQSAEAIDAEKGNTISLVESALQEIEELCAESLNNFALVMGKKDFDAKITLNKEISEQSFDQFITIYQAFRDIFRKAGGTIDKLAAKKALQKLQLDPDDEKEALKALDAISDDALTGEKPGSEGDPEEKDPIDEALNG